MCFSATASFIASGALIASGVATARISKPKFAVPLSMFPIVFAIHQFIEGLLWLNHRGFLSDNYRFLAVYTYLMIAYVFWPIFVPLSVYLF
ncbi:DUF6629 family protein, partial [Chloroflexota bacterium]